MLPLVKASVAEPTSVVVTRDASKGIDEKAGPVVRAGPNAKPSYQPDAVVTLQALWAQAQIELNALRV